MVMMIGVVEALVEVLINSGSELIKTGGRSFHSLALM